jgi:flagellar motor switch protein FliM
MPDVLDQNEVDALLAAVDSGGPSSAPKSVNAMPDLGFSIGGTRNDKDVEYQVYDFKRPERVSKDQMRALEALHEGFGRNFGASLSGYLRTIVEVSVAHLEQLTYSEFIHSLPNPTCFNLLKSEQLDGQICLEVSPLIIYPIIDRLLGGSNADLFIPQRPLTAIEQRLVDRITERATTYLSEAWSALTPVTFALHDTESNPQLVQIVPPNETVVVVGFELKMGSRTGTMSLCIPYNVIEPIMTRLSAQTWFSYQKKSATDELVRRLSGNVSNARVELRAVLAATTIRVSDLLSLQPGDIITTDKPVSVPATIEIGGKTKFHAALGRFRGFRSMQVARIEPGQLMPAPAKPAEPPAKADFASPAKKR